MRCSVPLLRDLTKKISPVSALPSLRRKILSGIFSREPEELSPKKKPSVFPVSFYFMKRGGKRHEKTASPLLRRIIEDTDYLSWVAGLPNGTAGKSHVLSFYELAKTRDSATVNGLFSFLEYLRRAQKDFKTISTSAKGNAVQIMSIHKSKGLEFPVVFLADAAKSFNVKDLDRTVIFHREMGLGIHYFDKEHMAHWPSLFTGWRSVPPPAVKPRRKKRAFSMSP